MGGEREGNFWEKKGKFLERKGKYGPNKSNKICLWGWHNDTSPILIISAWCHPQAPARSLGRPLSCGGSTRQTCSPWPEYNLTKCIKYYSFVPYCTSTLNNQKQNENEIKIYHCQCSMLQILHVTNFNFAQTFTTVTIVFLNRTKISCLKHDN